MWGQMTLGEFYDAIEGFNDLEEQRLRWQLWIARKICWYTASPHIKDKIEENEIIPIPEMDEEIKKRRRESLPIAQIIIDGTGQQ